MNTEDTHCMCDDNDKTTFYPGLVISDRFVVDDNKLRLRGAERNHGVIMRSAITSYSR